MAVVRTTAMADAAPINACWALHHDQEEQLWIEPSLGAQREPSTLWRDGTCAARVSYPNRYVRKLVPIVSDAAPRNCRCQGRFLWHATH